MDAVVIVMPQAIRQTQVEKEPIIDGVYNVPKIDLAQEEKSSKPICIGEHLVEEESEQLKQLLVEFKDCFTWSYEDLKGIDENTVVHTIPLIADVVLVTQRPYRTILRQLTPYKRNLKNSWM